MNNIINLNDYGYDPAVYPLSKGMPARVVAVHRSRYELVCERGSCFGVLKRGVYYNNSVEPFPTTGDFVAIDWQDSGDSLITATAPRRTLFSRLDPSSGGHGMQAVAANFDCVFIMMSLNQNFNLKRLERYMTLAWESGGQPVVVLTKADLADDCARYLNQAATVATGAEIFIASSKTGQGLDELRPLLAPRRTVVFLGSSGIGKSSLVNALAGCEVMSTGEIREDDARGRHTTTCRQLIRLPSGAMVIDTPGMRELGMWVNAEGLDTEFSDVTALFGRCRFSDCSHRCEPGCAVLAALDSGELSAERWASYVALRDEGRRVDPRIVGKDARHGKR